MTDKETSELHLRKVLKTALIAFLPQIAAPKTPVLLGFGHPRDILKTMHPIGHTA